MEKMWALWLGMIVGVGQAGFSFSETDDIQEQFRFYTIWCLKNI